MITLSRSVGKRGDGGEPLPAPFLSWSSRGIRFRRASVSMLAGIPGSFKSTIAMNAMVNMRTPTLVFSTDSSLETIQTRLLALASGQPTEQTESWSYSQPDKAAALLAQYDFLRWDFTPNPDLDDVWLSAYAYAEMHGVWPEQIVVDIASDIGFDTGDEWGSLRDLLRQAKVLARETGAHVLLVHHASDSQSTKRPCPRRSDIHGKVSQIPELIVTCGVDDEGRLHAAAVKSRWSKADKDAKDPFQMELHAERAFVGDHIEIPRSLAYGGGWAGESEDGWN